MLLCMFLVSAVFHFEIFNRNVYSLFVSLSLSVASVCFFDDLVQVLLDIFIGKNPNDDNFVGRSDTLC